MMELIDLINDYLHEEGFNSSIHKCVRTWDTRGLEKDPPRYVLTACVNGSIEFWITRKNFITVKVRGPQGLYFCQRLVRYASPDSFLELAAIARDLRDIGINEVLAKWFPSRTKWRGRPHRATSST